MNKKILVKLRPMTHPDGRSGLEMAFPAGTTDEEIELVTKAVMAKLRRMGAENVQATDIYLEEGNPP
jgi:hypothetical protein